MTPHAMAKAECANWHSGGCITLGKCSVAEGKCCAYFETCVLPLADQQGPANPKRQRQYSEAQVMYWDMVGQKPKTPRECP